MKRILEVGDVIRISAKNKEYADLTYEVRIVEVSDKMAKGKKMFKDGSLSMLGTIASTRTTTQKTWWQSHTEKTHSTAGTEW